jgi:hypothetical protein
MAIRSFNDLNKKQQLAVFIGVPALVVIILLTLIYRALGVLGADPDLPGFLQRSSLPDNKWGLIEAKNGEITAKNVIIARGPAAELELKSLEADIKSGRDRLPLESEKTEMRLLIDKLARDIPSDFGVVQVKSVKINEGSSASSRAGASARSGGSKPEQVTYQTELSGDLNGIIKYIDMIEKNPRFMLVNSFTLKPGKLGTDEEKRAVRFPHEVKMNIITYVYNPSGSVNK